MLSLLLPMISFKEESICFQKRMGFGFLLIPPPIFIDFFASDVGGTNRELGDFLNKPVFTRKNNFS